NQFQALSEAMSVPVNKMPKAQLQIVQDSEFFTLTSTIDSATILFSNNVNESPIAKDILVNYDANTLNKGAVHGIDYEYDQPTPTQVRVKALLKNNLKVRIV
ncbi:MAG: hypothetical protein L3I99_02025, partial [Sulfurimonas sp.]|nr:hypothetical protein [Sulfurimonas sp.]